MNSGSRTLVVLAAVFALLAGAAAQEVVVWGDTLLTNVPSTATNVVSVATSADTVVALREDGTAVAWGKEPFLFASATNLVKVVASKTSVIALTSDGWIVDGYGTALLPENGYTDVALGDIHGIALQEDGRVNVWGNNTFGQRDVPEWLGNVVAVSAGPNHCAALRSDRSVVQWGANTAGTHLGPFTWIASGGLSTYGGGVNYTLVLSPEGTLKYLGRVGFGNQFRDGTNLVQVVVRSNSAFGIRAGGALVAWGNANSIGKQPLPPGLSSVVAVAVSDRHAVAVNRAMRPRLLGPAVHEQYVQVGSKLPLFARVLGGAPMSYQWFRNGLPLPGTDTPSPRLIANLNDTGASYHVVVSNALGTAASEPVEITVSPVALWGRSATVRFETPSNLSDLVAVDAGGFHTLALRAQGTVAAWGKNIDGQAAVPAFVTNIVAVSAGGDHSLALRQDGTVLGWGRDWDGQTQPPPDATNVVAVSAGWAHSLALRVDGSIVAWGNNVYGQTEVPPTATQVKAIAVGHYHNVALRTDGAVVSWGSDYGVPANATNVIAVAAGWEHSLALRSDGSLVAWGDNSYGQLEVPADATNVLAIAAGYYHSVALLADGTLKSWGRGNLGVTNVPGGEARYCAVSAGDDFQVALAHSGLPRFGVQRTSFVANAASQAVLQANVCAAGQVSYQWYRDGTLVVGATQATLTIPVVRLADAGTHTLVASNSFGAVTSEPITLTVQPEPSVTRIAGGWGNNRYRQCDAFQALKSPIAVAAGNFHAIGLNADGTVAAWGKNRYGQTNVPVGATNIIAIAAGGNHSLALRDDGLVVGWGRDWDGQTLPPPDASNLVAIAAGADHSLGLRSDGTVFAWGNNEYGQTTLPSGLRNVTAIAAGYYHSLALRSDGMVIGWGLQDKVPSDATNIVAIAGGWWHSLAVRMDGTVVAWGDNRYGQCDVPEAATNIVAVSAGYGHSLALRSDGKVIAWGRSSWTLTSVPADLRDVAAISAGEDFNLVLVHQGAPTLRAPVPVVRAHVGAPAILQMQVSGGPAIGMRWHRLGEPIPDATNRWLVLPSGQPTNSGDYVLHVTNAAGVVETGAVALAVNAGPVIDVPAPPVLVLPGENFTLAARVYGAEPMSIQWLRDGVTLGSDARTQGANSEVLSVSGAPKEDSGFYTLSASNAFGVVTSEVIRVSITPILAWGDNSSGQLEVPEAAFDGIVVKAGDEHSLALLPNGRVVGWGSDLLGKATPPTTLTDAVAIAAGEDHSVALTVKGEVVSWGAPLSGIPKPLSATNIIAIAAGRQHTLALRGDGVVFGWGGGMIVPLAATNAVAIASSGSIGLALRADGTVLSWGNPYRAPDGLSNVVAIAVGDFHAVALRQDGSVVTWGKNSLVDHSVPPSATNIIAISAGGQRTLALRKDGMIITWGAEDAGPGPTFAKGSQVRSVAAGGAHNLALIGTGISSTPALTRTYEVLSQKSFFLTDVNSSPALSYQWSHEGVELLGATNRFLKIPRAQFADSGRYELVTVGLDGGQTRQAFQLVVTPREVFVETGFVELLKGWGETFCLEPVTGGDEPVVYQWLLNGTNLVDGDGVAGARSHTLCISNLKSLDAGQYSLAASNAFGAVTKPLALLTVTPVFAWGTSFNDVTNVPVSTTNIIALAAAQAHNLALRSDGSVVGWGTDSIDHISGAESVSNAVALFTSTKASYALDSEGKLKGWGQALVPPRATNIVLLDSGAAGTIALRADGSVVVWDVQGASFTNSLPPGRRFVDVASGPNFVAVCDDGSVVAGGATGTHVVPLDATNVVKIAAGGEHFLALRRDGTVLAWGNNLAGETTVPSAASNVVAIVAENAKSLALRADGTVVKWGYQPVFSEPPLPAVLPSLVSVELGSAHFVGLRETTPLQEFTQRRAKILTPGASQLLLAPRPGPEICAYQWQLDGQDLPGATNSFLLLDNFQSMDQATYRAVVRTPFRTVIGPATYLGAEGAPLMLRVISATGTQPDSTLRLRLLGASGAGPIIIESSADLSNWAPVLTNEPAVGPTDLNVSLTNQPGRFFRVLELR